MIECDSSQSFRRWNCKHRSCPVRRIDLPFSNKVFKQLWTNIYCETFFKIVFITLNIFFSSLLICLFANHWETLWKLYWQNVHWCFMDVFRYPRYQRVFEVADFEKFPFVFKSKLMLFFGIVRYNDGIGFQRSYLIFVWIWNRFRISIEQIRVQRSQVTAHETQHVTHREFVFTHWWATKLISLYSKAVSSRYVCHEFWCSANWHRSHDKVCTIPNKWRRK